MRSLGRVGLHKSYIDNNLLNKSGCIVLNGKEIMVSHNLKPRMYYVGQSLSAIGAVPKIIQKHVGLPCSSEPNSLHFEICLYIPRIRQTHHSLVHGLLRAPLTHAVAVTRACSILLVSVRNYNSINIQVFTITSEGFHWISSTSSVIRVGEMCTLHIQCPRFWYLMWDTIRPWDGPPNSLVLWSPSSS